MMGLILVRFDDLDYIKDHIISLRNIEAIWHNKDNECTYFTVYFTNNDYYEFNMIFHDNEFKKPKDTIELYKYLESNDLYEKTK